jgi:capsule biosynthesis phosphatase
MYTGLTFVFDIDGTICPIKEKTQEYIDLIPFKSIVDKIREYKEGGARIVLFTARNMKSYNGNIGMINANTAKVMLEWLDKWEIPYDEIIYGKPWPGPRGFYVDDRSIRPDEFMKYSEEELNEICKNSKEEYGYE